MTQLVLNIEDRSIMPSLRRVLTSIKGVTVVKQHRVTAKSETNIAEEQVLQSISKGIKEVKEAQAANKELPLLDDLIKELQEEVL